MGFSIRAPSYLNDSTNLVVLNLVSQVPGFKSCRQSGVNFQIRGSTEPAQYNYDFCTPTTKKQFVLIWAYFGYCEYRVTFCLLARLAGTPKLGLAPLPNPLRVGHTTIIVG